MTRYSVSAIATTAAKEVLNPVRLTELPKSYSAAFRKANNHMALSAGKFRKVSDFTPSSPMPFLFCLNNLQLPHSTFDTWPQISEVENMGLIEHNWNGYGSEAPNDLAREMAKSILFDANRLAPMSSVVKSAQGGVSIYFISGKKRADIECLNTGEIVGTRVDGDSYPVVWDIKPGNISMEIRGIAEFLGLPISK